MQVNNDRALATGLIFRPIEETAKDMLAKLDKRGESDEWRGGLDLETEAALLRKWHMEKGGGMTDCHSVYLVRLKFLFHSPNSRG